MHTQPSSTNAGASLGNASGWHLPSIPFSTDSFFRPLSSHTPEALNLLTRTQVVPEESNLEGQIDLLTNARGLKAGNTPVFELPELSDFFGIKQLLIKDESSNPFGTHKDRKSDYAVEYAFRHRTPPEALCILTAGNAGLSLAGFAAPRKLPVIAITGSLDPSIESQLNQTCERVYKVDLQERCWSSADLRRFAGNGRGQRILDVTNLAAPYKQLAYEIAPYQPDFIVLPVGGGELFLGLAAGIRELRLRTKLIGITVNRSDSVADKLYAKWTPHRGRIKSLTNLSSEHSLYVMDDESSLSETLTTVSRYLRCEFSSATAFDVLRRFSFKSSEKVMVFNTGSFVDRSSPVEDFPPG